MIGEISMHGKKSIITKKICCSPNVLILIITVIMTSIKKESAIILDMYELNNKAFEDHLLTTKKECKKLKKQVIQDIFIQIN